MRVSAVTGVLLLWVAMIAVCGGVRGVSEPKVQLAVDR